MTVQELVEAVRNVAENSVNKLKIESWLSVELGRIVNRKPYFWRKAALQFDTTPNTATYNLSDQGAAALNVAPDFLQFATPLYQFQGASKIGEVPFASDHLTQLQMIRDTSTGTPGLMTIEPGTIKTVRLNPIPNAVYSYSAIYYREAIIHFKTPDYEADEIPIVPAAFHYVVYQAMERRVFFYLYGQKDPRAAI